LLAVWRWSENSFFANICSLFCVLVGSDESHHLRLPPTLTHARVHRRMISSRALDNYTRSQSPEWPSTRLAAHNPKPGVSSRRFVVLFSLYFSLCISLWVTCVVHSALLSYQRDRCSLSEPPDDRASIIVTISPSSSITVSDRIGQPSVFLRMTSTRRAFHSLVMPALTLENALVAGGGWRHLDQSKLLWAPALLLQAR